jgi:hypothetical protein
MNRFNCKFPYDYSKDLFDKFTIFINANGELEIANHDHEIVMQNRVTGIHCKANINEFVNIIKTIFPDRREQKQLLIQMFRNEESSYEE